MRALVVVESVFGNTRQVAEAVAEGLGDRMAVEVLEPAQVPAGVPGDDVRLLLVGGPTHALGMSRPGTREDAARQAGKPAADGTGIREWLEALPAPPPGTLAATFDTRVAKPRVPGSAARAAAKRLRKRGWRLAAPAESYYVEGTDGPLLDGELDRARTWGRDLAAVATGGLPTQAS